MSNNDMNKSWNCLFMNEIIKLILIIVQIIVQIIPPTTIKRTNITKQFDYWERKLIIHASNNIFEKHLEVKSTTEKVFWSSQNGIIFLGHIITWWQMHIWYKSWFSFNMKNRVNFITIDTLLLRTTACMNECLLKR